jgi:hypothetical protein
MSLPRAFRRRSDALRLFYLCLIYQTLPREFTFCCSANEADSVAILQGDLYPYNETTSYSVDDCSTDGTILRVS